MKCESMNAWNMKVWTYKMQAMWKHEYMKCETMKIYKCMKNVRVNVWKYENMKVWKYESMKAWNVKQWKYMNAWKMYAWMDEHMKVWKYELTYENMKMRSAKMWL